MLNRFIVPFLLLLFFSFPAWGGRNQPEKIQKQSPADSSLRVQQQGKTTDQEAVSTLSPDQVSSEDDTEEDTSVFDDEHG